MKKKLFRPSAHRLLEPHIFRFPPKTKIWAGGAPQAKTLGIFSGPTGSGIKDRTTAKFKLDLPKFKSFEDFRLGGKGGPQKIPQFL